MKAAHSSLSFATLALIASATLPLRADEQRQRAAADGTAAKTEAKLELNTASLDALAAEPAIGPELAKTIIAARPFKTLHDLDRLPDLTTERLEQIRGRVTVAPHVKTPLGEPTTSKKRLGMPRAAADDHGRIDVNTADVKTLAAVPVIGPELARAIVAARPFASLEELNRVKGINMEQLEPIKAALIVIPPRRGDSLP